MKKEKQKLKKDKFKIIQNLSMTYSQWHKYLKPLMINGKLSDIYFTLNYFYDIPKNKKWMVEKGAKSTFCGLPARRIIVGNNAFIDSNSCFIIKPKNKNRASNRGTKRDNLIHNTKKIKNKAKIK